MLCWARFKLKLYIVICSKLYYMYIYIYVETLFFDFNKFQNKYLIKNNTSHLQIYNSLHFNSLYNTRLMFLFWIKFSLIIA